MIRDAVQLNVRRLAALDMHGARGTRRRRRVILAEFALGTIGSVVLGAWALTWGDAAGVVLGIWLLGLAANYLPLTAHVLALWQPEVLRAELARADLDAELRHYTRVQIWVLVPFWVAGLALAQIRRRTETFELGTASGTLDGTPPTPASFADQPAPVAHRTCPPMSHG